MPIDVKETLYKLRQITGGPKRFRRNWNRADAERILLKHCNAAGLDPVYEGELDAQPDQS
jgi:hypothetical protein